MSIILLFDYCGSASSGISPPTWLFFLKTVLAIWGIPCISLQILDPAFPCLENRLWEFLTGIALNLLITLSSIDVLEQILQYMNVDIFPFSSLIIFNNVL